MQTWWIGPTIGFIFGAAGWLRGRRADARLAAIERALTGRAVQEPLDPARPLPPEVHAADGDTTKKALADAISDLPEREKLIITLYYYEELTLREIGEVLGLSESRVSQLHTRAVLRLKAHLADDDIGLR